MTVKELKEELNSFDDNTLVVIDKGRIGLDPVGNVSANWVHANNFWDFLPSTEKKYGPKILIAHIY